MRPVVACLVGQRDIARHVVFDACQVGVLLGAVVIEVRAAVDQPSDVSTGALQLKSAVTRPWLAVPPLAMTVMEVPACGRLVGMLT